MTTKEIYDYICAIIKKEVYGAVKVPMVEVIFNAAQVTYFNELVQVMETTLKLQHSLSPFTKTMTLQVESGGFCNINKDNDFHYGPVASGVSAWQVCGDKPGRSYPVDWLTDSEWNDATISEIQPPTLQYPVARFGGPSGQSSRGWIEVMPKDLSYVSFKYLTKPRNIVFGGTYTPQGGFLPDSNAPGNVNPEWNDLDMFYLIGQTILDLGMPLDDDAVKQAGAMKARGTVA